MAKRKTLTISEYELPVKIEGQKEGGYVAKCEAWSDCYAQGDTVEEAINEISYVASSLIELYQEEGMPVPLQLKSKSEEPAASLSFNFPLVVAT